MTNDPYYARLLEVVQQPELHAAPDPHLVARLTPPADPGYTPPPVEVEEREVSGPAGPIPVRIYRPLVDQLARPGLVWCHGGGWVGGSLDMPEADAAAREVCARADCVVVSVDYRLAVDGVHYPAPLDDVIAVYRWTVTQAGILGVDPDIVSIGGASAGANLAAGASLRLRDEHGPLPHRTLLIYSCVHARLPKATPELAAKVARLSPMWAFTAEVLTPTIENYLGAPIDAAPIYAMPGGCDVRGLPPTLIVNCEYDGLRASGEAFAQELTDADVPVRQMCVQQTAHGHLNHPWTPGAQATLRAMAQCVRRTDADAIAPSSGSGGEPRPVSVRSSG